MPMDRHQIARRIAREIQPGFVVNLGIGIPTLAGNYISGRENILLQSENGLLGLGPFPLKGEEDPDLINAGKQTVTAVRGASFFSSAESFAMIRGGHVDLSVLGALQADQEGSIANWMVPGKMVKGMGGAMDLVAGAKKVIAAMLHRDKNGRSKLKAKCDLPLTGVRCVHRIVTDLGVFDIIPEGFLLRELAPGATANEAAAATEGDLKIAKDVREIVF